MRAEFNNGNSPLPPMGIKSWALDDRPREKLLSKGQASLSDAELLGIIIGSGTKEGSAVELGKKILGSVANSLSEVSRLSVSDLTRFKGIGIARAINIVAALELGRRRRFSESITRKTVTSSRDAFELMHSVLSDVVYEEFWIITLNRGNMVKRTIRISEGSVAGTVADPKKIFKLALEDNASAIILCHNHPSGAIKPSENDIRITRKCKEAGKFMELPVLDHLIIGDDSFFSFADEGLL